MNSDTDYKALNIDPDILAKAWDGDATSQLILGKAFFNAVYVKDNCLNAFKWFQLSAEQGNMEAQFRLADLFALDQGTPKSYTDLYECYTKSALQGYKKALIRIFNLYQQDKKMHCRGELNSEEHNWVMPKFRKDNNIRELNEYRLKYHGSKLNHAIDYYTKLFIMLKSGNQNDPNASLKLGFLYQHGFGVKKCTKLAIDYYTEAAKQGNRDAQYHLGYLYENDTDIEFNYYIALKWYRSSATSGNVAAQNALGYFYEKGFATELYFKGAIYWYTKAANSGNSDAQLTLGKLYRKGNGADVDIPKAIKWYNLAANRGNGAAQNCLNQLYRNGKKSQLSGIISSIGYVGKHQTKPNLRSKLQDDVEKLNNSPHIIQLKKLAENALRTDGNAMFTLGMKYYNGEEFTQDKDAGFQWIKKAAKAGSQKAELKVAEMYKDGGDVPGRDLHESSIWTTKLVKQRNSVAQCNLGLLYLSGEGVRKDPLEASKWFTKSADQGNAEAQYQFGLLRLKGLGLRKDPKEALEWFNKSALHGNINALYQLGKLYEEGGHIEKDVCRAIKLYEYSANNGNQSSRIKLAKAYEEGKLVDQDLQIAEKYYKLAAEFSVYQLYELAKKYVNGAFGDSYYIKAFKLFKKLAYEEPSSGYNIFQVPLLPTISLRYENMDYMNLVAMLKLVSERGEQEVFYSIGYLYENGIVDSWDIVLFPPNFTHARNWYSTAAINGDFRAKVRLGIMYHGGKGVDTDFAIAYNYYLESHENGLDEATYQLALMYLNGEGVSQDLIKAYCLFTEASDKGNEFARTKVIHSNTSDNLEMLEAAANAGYVAVQYQLGVFYQEEGKSDRQAIKWLTLASNSGVTDASYRLGVTYEGLKGKDQSYVKAIGLFSEAAKQDHEGAMYELARIYHLGKCVDSDYQKAYDLYTRAAELGHSESSRILDINNHSIGQYDFEDGEASHIEYSEDLNNSLSLIEFMAKKGDVDLQYVLGTFYMSNKDRLNYSEAFKWYEIAASNGLVSAIYQLGLLYENGRGTVQDYRMAYRLYSQAKEKGHQDAIYRLGIAYHYGLGVNINSAEAFGCYLKAAELGNNESQYKLGKLYESGEIFESDTLKTLEWYTEAYLNGNYDVINDLYQLYDDELAESCFYKKLFRIVSNIENTYKRDDGSYKKFYGSMYFKLGMMHLNGHGTVKSTEKAFRQFLKAYHSYKYENALRFISFDYDQYEASSQISYLDRLKVYSEIQDQITDDDQYELGMLYYNGIQDKSMNSNVSNNPDLSTVLPPDYSMAFRYFSSACRKKHQKAQEKIALMYLNGLGVNQDHQKALECFSISSKAMSAFSCYYRGLNFYRGNNKAVKNHEIAIIYFQEAIKKNHNGAQEYHDTICLNEIEAMQPQTKEMEQIEKKIEKMDPSLLYHRGIDLYRGCSSGDKNYGLSSLYIRTAAGKKHKLAMAQLGKMYLDGKAFEKDQNQAMQWVEKSIEYMNANECYDQAMDFYNSMHYTISLFYMKKAAEENNGYAQSHIGLMYLQGHGAEKNYEQAMKWFKRSTLHLDTRSCHDKGMEFYRSVEIDYNYEVALVYLQNAAEKNDISAQAQLHTMYLQGLAIEGGHGTAIKWIEPSIKTMDAFDFYNYGMMFYNGVKVEKSYNLALFYLQKAANQDYGAAQAQIGLMYIGGYAVSKIEYEGMRWIEKSLKNMKQYECYRVGSRLYNQYESEKPLELAFTFIKNAAEKSYGLAQALLGEMYLEGKGVQKNQDSALKWIEESVRNLEPSQCYDQGMKYHNGFDVENNYNVAMFYLQAAKRKKYTLAKVQIGVMYIEGHGVEKDEETAMECFQQSVAKMDPEECYRHGIMLDNEHHHDTSLFYIRRAAEAGYGLAESQLGIVLLEGKGIQKNQAESMKWIEKSLDSMSSNDCYKQGMSLYRGTTVVKDYAISFCFMEKAAEKGHVLAQAHLALVYYQGFGVEKNKNEAKTWIEKSLQYLSPDECYEQGKKFYNGTEVDPDYEITLLYIQKAAENYHGPSQAQLALMYLEGSFVEKNHDTAMYWIDKSMNEMTLEECYRQGMVFYHRAELENNYDIALRYLKRASKANAYAKAQLGYMYLNGVGVDQNHEEAARWHNIVENNCISDSRYCRSRIYHCDQGGMQDFPKTFKLYQEELGFIEQDGYLLKYPSNCGALRGIGLLHEYGDGVTQDFKKALKYYGRSASDKYMAAYYNIGLLYYYGKGVDQNYKEALVWFTKVANSEPDLKELHVFIEENSDDTKGTTGSSMHTYSLQPESRIVGEAHYYIGLMYSNGFFVDQDEDRAQDYFKMANIHGVKLAKNISFERKKTPFVSYITLVIFIVVYSIYYFLS